MCPFCLATIGLVVAGAVSTSGLAALTVKVSRRKGAGEILLNSDERKNQNVHDHDRKTENSISR
jgi:hypothetical protein